MRFRILLFVGFREFVDFVDVVNSDFQADRYFFTNTFTFGSRNSDLSRQQLATVNVLWYKSGQIC